MADDSGSEALANGGMGIRHGEVVGTADFFKDVVVVEQGKPKIFPGGVIVSKTAYHIRGEQDDTPERYVDAETVPYVVVPPVIINKTPRSRPRLLCPSDLQGQIGRLHDRRRRAAQ
jgi:hypothetical protein